MSDSVSSVWGHSVHFAKFPMLRFSKGYWSQSFHSILIKLHKILKFYDTLTLFFNTGPYETGNFKMLLLIQFLSDLSQTL